MLKVTKKQTESDNFPAKSGDEIEESRKSRFFHPYSQLFISVVLTAISQILLKTGVDTQFVSPWYTASNLFAFWIWLGILAIIGSLFSWLLALKSVPLIIAFNLAATNHIMVAIGSWVFLGEGISSQRWIGIFLVTLGVFFVSPIQPQSASQLASPASDRPNNASEGDSDREILKREEA